MTSSYRVYAVALILGSVGGILVMGFHPTGSDLLGQPGPVARRFEQITVATHWLAVITAAIILFGFVGLCRYLSIRDPFVQLAMILSGFGLFGALIAAVINGLVGPSITNAMLASDPETERVLRLILKNNTLLNQAFDKIFIIFSALATGIWAARLFVRSKSVGAIGFLSSIASLGLIGGNIKMDVHGFMLLALLYEAWIMGVAILLWRESKISR